MNKEEFDQLFDKAFDESVNTYEFIPDSSNSWAKVQKQLRKQSRRKRQLRLLPYIAAAFIFGAIVFGTPTVTNAFQPFYKAITSIKDGVINIIWGTGETHNTKPRTPPPPGHVNSGGAGNSSTSEEIYHQEFKTWDEASTVVDYPIPKDIYVPTDYKLENIKTLVGKTSEKSIFTTLQYNKSEFENYHIKIKKLVPAEMIQSGADTSKNDIIMETLQIGDNTAYLFITNDGTTSMEFLNANYHVSIVGAITKKEAIKIATDLVQK
ncbi:DUF4367 domain-containing protein [Paenibacillus sp. GSMTC-2017]|uniref:DUF4367 domain-containing protein n=1 Tax=Paenibacillus sp. GSMTC-2017 TaxID=2794350 RepID=UPI0018D94458|nr:DUF4367 domain-containing protein [Paenibacillus sp. GSMTC-2017]MBH5320456.1 DUF4367 domain-containing protein [Paenibacillus sp. GSMTC-2017]